MRIHVISKRILLDSTLFLMKLVKVVSTQFTVAKAKIVRHYEVG